METNESSIDPLVKALTVNKSQLIIDVARYKDPEVSLPSISLNHLINMYHRQLRS